MVVELMARAGAGAQSSSGPKNTTVTRRPMRDVLVELDRLRPSTERLTAVIAEMTYVERMTMLHKLLSRRTEQGGTNYNELLVRTGRAEGIRKILQQFRDILKAGIVILDVAAVDGTVLRIASEVASGEFGTVHANNPFVSTYRAVKRTLKPLFEDRLMCPILNPLEDFAGVIPGVDVVIVALAAHHVENGDKKKLLINAARAVRPGGHLILIEPWPVVPLNGGACDPIITTLFNSLTFPTRDMGKLRDIVIEMGGMTEQNTTGTSVPLPDGSKLYGADFQK